MDVFDLVARISVDTKPYEDGLNDASKKSESFASKMGNGLKTAAKVGAVAMTAVTTAGVTLSKTLISGASEVASYGDNIDKMSQKMGISAQAYQEWDAILQHSGTSIDSMSRGMQTLQKNAVNSADKFAKLGISQEQLASMSTEELFSATISGLQQMGEGAERTALASELLGGSAKELGALLNTSAEETEQMRKKVHELGGVMSDEAVKASAKFQDNLQDMKTALSGIKRDIISDTLPAFNDLMEGFTMLLTGQEGADEAIEKGMQSLNSAIDKIIPKLGNLLEKLVPAVLQVGVKLVSSLAEQIPKVITSIAKMIPSLAKQLVEAITKIFPELIQAGVDLLTSLADGMDSGVDGAVDIILDLFNTILDTLIKNLPKILDAGIKIVGKLAEGIVRNLPRIVDAILQGIKSLIQTIVQNLPQFLRQGKDIILNLIKGIAQALPNIISSIVDMISTLIDTIIDSLPDILEAGVEIIVELARGLVEAIPKIVEKIPEIITGFVEALLSPDSIARILQAGLDMIGKLFEGILNGDFVGMAVDLIASLGKAILGALGGLLSIGAKIIGAIWDGMKKAWQAVDNWLSEVVYGVISEAVGDATSAAGSVASAGVSNYNGNKSGYNKSDAVGTGDSYAARAQNISVNTYVGNRRLSNELYVKKQQASMRSSGR